MKRMVARDIMTTPVITVRPDTPFRELVDLMMRHRVSGLPVVDEGGRLVGVVTEADLIHKEETPLPEPPLIPWHGGSLRLERLVDRYQKATGTTARDLMTENVVTASEDTPVRELAHLMLTHHINRIPIVRDGRVVGIVARTDILKVFTRRDEELVAVIRETLAEDLWIDPANLTITCQDGVVTIAGEVDRLSDRDLIIKWVRSIDGVVRLDADRLTYRINDLALGKVAY
jgi:CBS-domain-containing membrane protein